MNKRAIELSINFIVMFILGMSMFAAGVAVMRKVFGDAEELKQGLDAQTREQIERMLISSSDKVVVPLTQKQVEAGGHTVFGVGVRNDLATKKDFFVHWQFDAAYGPKNVRICDTDIDPDCLQYSNWFGLSPSIAYPLAKNEHAIADLFLQVPKKDSADAKTAAGTYVFNIQVCAYDSGLYGEGKTPAPLDCEAAYQYDTTKKIRVIVS